MAIEMQQTLWEELLTKRELAQQLKLSQRSIDRKIEAGEFPKGLTLGGARRWRSSEISDWIRSGCPKVSK